MRPFLLLLVWVLLGSGLAPRLLQAEQPWEFDPYRVEIWVATAPNHALPWQEFAEPLIETLERTFAASWQTTVRQAPETLRADLLRGVERLTYDRLVANDLVLAIPPDAPEASAIHTPETAAERLREITATRETIARLGASDDPEMATLAAKLKRVSGGATELLASWGQENPPALVLPRGLIAGLTPAPRVIELPTTDQIAGQLKRLDKLMLVQVDTAGIPIAVTARELDCPMRHLGPAVGGEAFGLADLPSVAARCLTRAFAPVVRIEDAGRTTVRGRVRAGGLLLRGDSPAAVRPGDFLQPMLRRDDRSGQPAILTVIDWTYLQVTESEGPKVAMEVYAGRVGGLQARSNRRTHKVALKVRPYGRETVLRLHARGDPDQPLIGYEIHEKDLESAEMALVGRTDWDGRLRIEKTADPLRLLYVKNGGSVLARLPMVPGQTSLETADLIGDDLRLRAEAYLKGVENAIIDLVAIRQLLAARIQMRLEKNEVDEAVDLLERLREQPTYEVIADDMQRKATLIRSDNPLEQQKIDRMFAHTRSLLVQHISPRLVNELERDVAAMRGTSPGEEP